MTVVRWLGTAASVLALSSPNLTAQGGPSTPVVVTEGEAVVKRAADRAWLTVATETRDARATEARRRSAENTSALVAALKQAGVAADAIRTTSFALVPEMSWNNGRGTVRGYLVRNQVEVRIDNLDRLSEVIEAANTPSGSSISVIGPRFDLRDRAAAENEALGQAVQVALGRAHAIANGAKRTVGTIVRIEERGRNGPMPEVMMMRESAARGQTVETPILPGDIEIRASVSMTVELR